MMGILWRIIGYIGTVAFGLVLIGTCILLVCAIICIIKQVKELFE